MVVPVVVTNGGSEPNKLRVNGNGEAFVRVLPNLPLYEAYPLINSDFGNNLAQDAGFGGTPELVHDGTDTAAWTGSNVSGNKVTFNSTNRVLSGSASIEVANPGVGNIWQFLRASSIDLSNYAAISFLVNVDSNWAPGDVVVIYGWDSGTAAVVGNSVMLEDYFDEFDFDVTQNVVIPLEDMGLDAASIDAFRMELTSKSGQAPTFYLDEMQIEETSGALDFIYKPPADKIVHVERFAIFATTTVTETVMKDYDKFFGIPEISNGTIFNIQSRGVFLRTFSPTRIADFLRFPQTQPFEVIAGTSVTMAKLITEFQIELDGTKGDFFQMTVQDDLSAMIDLSQTLFGWVEDTEVEI